MHYSLIIPAWNEAAFIAHTIESVQAAMQQLEKASNQHGQLIVVDNNSSDDTASIARSLGASVVFEPVNQIARARNRGASSASGAVLIFLDADTTCSATLLAHVLERAATGQVVGGGSQIAPDKVVAASGMRGIALWNWISRTARLAAGCFVFCRRDAFEDVGGFSDKVFAGEEIFLSRQLKRWGKSRRMSFEIMSIDPVVTSVRKLEWYSPTQVILQALLVLIPGALYSRRLCRLWYEDRSRNRSE